MAYSCNTNDANTYSTSSAYEDLGDYPVLNHTSAAEGASDKVSDTCNYGWGMPGRLGLMLNSPTSSRVTTGYGKHHRDQFVAGHLTCVSAEPAASASLYGTEVNTYCQPTYSGHFQSTVGHQTQSYNPTPPNGSFPSTMVLGLSTVVPNPSSGKNPLTLEP